MEIRWLGDFDPFAHVVEAAPVNAPPLGRVGEVFRPFTAECQQFRGTGLQSAGSVLQRKIKDIALFRCRQTRIQQQPAFADLRLRAN